jgi:hypothetical protein
MPVREFLLELDLAVLRLDAHLEVARVLAREIALEFRMAKRLLEPGADLVAQHDGPGLALVLDPDDFGEIRRERGKVLGGLACAVARVAEGIGEIARGGRKV